MLWLGEGVSESWGLPSINFYSETANLLEEYNGPVTLKMFNQRNTKKGAHFTARPFRHQALKYQALKYSAGTAVE